MIIINKIKDPVRRLFVGGFNKTGVVTRGVDTRNYGQLQDTVDAYAIQIPEVKEFVRELRTLNPKDLGTICDTLELSNYHTMLTSLEAKLDKAYTEILKDELLGQMIQSSKENPAGMDLVNSIINNTDPITSKYALYTMSGGILNDKNVARQMIATSKVVPEIAQETLQGSYTMDFSKQERFMNFIKLFVNPESQPDMIKFLFKKLVPFTGSRQEMFNIDLPALIRSKVDVEDVAARLKMLPKFLEEMGEKLKDFDVVSYLTQTNKV